MIELHDVSRQYSLANSQINVLKSLNLSISERERVAIVGPSGCGKSTLLLIMTGLEEATTGTVAIDGQILSTLSADQRADLRRDHIGIVFQSFHLIPSLSARENISLALEISGQSNSRSITLDMLDQVGLLDRADHYPAQLSGGEQQRVAMARALVHQPKLIVADEPTGNLDENTGETIMNLLFTLNQDTGTTLLLVTHDLELAARCDRTLRLQDGYLSDVSRSQPKQSIESP